MPELQISRLGIGAIIFLIGALIYVVNFLMALGRRKPLAIDGVGLMVLGLGLSIVLRW